LLEEVDMVVRSIAPLSVAKIAGVLYALIGLIIGVFIALAALAGAFAGAEGTGIIGSIMGVGAIVAFPVFYGCIGFVSTLIGAWLYNLVAGMIGGIRFEVA
jgi:hypothetical protein